MKFAVWIVTAPGNAHWQGLRDAAEGLVFGLEQLGHDVALYARPTVPTDCDRLVILNGQCMDAEAVIPENTIFYNAEQMPVVGQAVQPAGRAYLDRLAKHAVWDYSDTNRARLKALGIASALCPIGYYPGLSFLPQSTVKVTPDIDVLFCGSLNERRHQILLACQARGLHVKHMFGIYGSDLDRYIARSKICLNVHFYDHPIWEIFRCSYLLANQKCVVSENNGCDEQLEQLARMTTALVPYDSLAGTCMELARNDKRRDALAECGYEQFRKRDQVEYVRVALAATP